MVDVDIFWGCPDEVSYETTESYGIKTLYFEDNGYVFGIWGNVFVAGNDEDDTATLMHDDLITYYIYYHGWSGDSSNVGGSILPIKDVYPGSGLDWLSICDLFVKYEHDEEFEESGEDRITYGDLISSLGKPRCYGRILYDWVNNISFISFWSLPTLDEMKEVVKYYGNFALNSYFVECSTKYEAIEHYKSGRKNLTFGEVIKNGGSVNISDNSELLALHNMKASDKWKRTDSFRKYRDEKLGKKLGNMTMAQYHNLIYGENSDYLLDKIILEEVSSYLDKNVF